GQKLVAKVVSVSAAGDTPIPEGAIVLWGSNNRGRWIEDHLAIDSTVEIMVSFGTIIDNATEVVGGNGGLSYPLLTDGELDPFVLNKYDSQNRDRHPRTIVA